MAENSACVEVATIGEKISPLSDKLGHFPLLLSSFFNGKKSSLNCFSTSLLQLLLTYTRLFIAICLSHLSFLPATKLLA